MAQSDQIEIIDASGRIAFRDLDPQQGITNIGSHPTNDVVIDSPAVAPFQAVLDHQRKPYQIMALGDGVQVRLRGEMLPANVFQELHDWDSIEIDGHTLILLEGGAGEALAGLPADWEEAQAGSIGLPAAEPGAPLPRDAGQVPEPAGARALVDHRDELILLELSAREWTVDVEQPATCQLTIVNGGRIVATFSVAVEGLDPSWVTVTPPRVNLNEGGRATVQISMTAPRRPSSRAGIHQFAVHVGSPNYPGHASRVTAVLNLNPYFEFGVGDLSPKQQTVSYRRRSGHVTLPVTNRGNSEAAVRVEAEDDRRACSFEFLVPGESASLFKQAEVRLDPEESLALRIAVTPLRRRIVGLRHRRFNYTVTATQVEGNQIPRTTLGTLKAAPLIGPGLIALMLLILAVLIVFLFRPVGIPDIAIAERGGMRPGSAILLDYDASRFAGLSPANVLNQLNSVFLRLTLEVRGDAGDWQIAKSPSELDHPAGRSTESPMQNVKYRLKADTWLSSIIPLLRGLSREVQVYVTPVEPKILRFGADRPTVIAGETVMLFWEVADAETLTLEHDGIQDSLTDAELVRGHRPFTLDKDTIFTLTAANSTGSQPVKKSLSIDVLAPTPTPIPTPVILRFDVNPLSILAGESVKVGWEVSGADTVSIQNIGDGLPLKGDVNKQLMESTYYQLVAIKSAEDGTQAKNQSLLQEVIVSPQPTATPVPVAPRIMVFEAVPKEIVARKGTNVRLTWSVAGDTTDIAISSPTLALSGLEAQDYVTVTVNETTLFVLTASNGTLKTSQATEVKATEPTPTPTPTPVPTAVPPTPMPTPTATPFPPPVIAYFKAEAVDLTQDSVVFMGMEDEGSGPIYVYQVEGGSHVKLSWQVRNAETVELQNFGPQPAEGTVTLPDPQTVNTSIMLTAANNGGANVVRAYIRIEIVSPVPPPPPASVTGVEDRAATTNTIYWSYSPADRLEIIGFRVYRSTPPGLFSQLVTLYDPNGSEYVDQIDPTCGRAYYVVALYIDYVTGGERETDSSLTSWYSRTCE